MPGKRPAQKPSRTDDGRREIDAGAHAARGLLPYLEIQAASRTSGVCAHRKRPERETGGCVRMEYGQDMIMTMRMKRASARSSVAHAGQHPKRITREFAAGRTGQGERAGVRGGKGMKKKCMMTTRTMGIIGIHGVRQGSTHGPLRRLSKLGHPAVMSKNMLQGKGGPVRTAPGPPPIIHCAKSSSRWDAYFVRPFGVVVPPVPPAFLKSS